MTESTLPKSIPWSNVRWLTALMGLITTYFRAIGDRRFSFPNKLIYLFGRLAHKEFTFGDTRHKQCFGRAPDIVCGRDLIGRLFTRPALVAFAI